MRRYLSIALAFVLGVALASGGFFLFGEDGSSFEVEYADSSWAYDISDPELVADNVDTVFIGTVTAREGQVSDDLPVPISLWEVDVAETLQGDLPSTVTVAQRGGFNEAEGRLYLMAGDQLLMVGATYLLAANHSAEDGWYMMLPSPAAGEIPSGLARDNDIRQRWVDAIGERSNA